MYSTGNQGQTLRQLESVGLSAYEARAYLALLTTATATGYELAKGSGIPSSKIYETLQRLVAKGAALVSSSKPPMYRAIPPEEWLARIREQTEASLTALTASLPKLAPTATTGLVWRLTGDAAIRDHLATLLREAEREVFLSIWPQEVPPLAALVAAARRRRVRLWIATFGRSALTGKDVYDLLSCGTSSAARLGTRLTAAVADDRRVLIARFADGQAATGSLADDPALALIAKEYIIHDLVNHALIEELGPAHFARMRAQHPLTAGLLGPGPQPPKPRRRKEVA
jgi:HTH-type transcriptional regulator, sugar sensing transcriptional regulator